MGRTATSAPGSRVPVHLHEREDEIIFIQRGAGSATIGDREVGITPAGDVPPSLTPDA